MKALVGAFSVITNLRIAFVESLVRWHERKWGQHFYNSTWIPSCVGGRRSFEASFDHHGIVYPSCARLGAGVVCDGEYLILFWWWWRRKNWEWSLATILYLLGHLNLIVCIQMWLPRPRRAPAPAASVHTQAITSHIVTPIDDGQNQERKDVCITYFIKVRRWLFYALATRCYYWSADLVSVARPAGKINHYC